MPHSPIHIVIQYYTLHIHLYKCFFLLQAHTATFECNSVTQVNPTAWVVEEQDAMRGLSMFVTI